MDQFLSAETLIIELLLVVTIAVQRFMVPYTVALVVVGLAAIQLRLSQWSTEV